MAIQLGLVGAVVLWAMWIAHLLLFRGNGLAEWIGLVVVVQNIVGSLFNSHLFDFAQGWVYVLRRRRCRRHGAEKSGDEEAGRRRGQAAMNRIELPARPRILVIALAPARRRAADHAADPQPAARLAGGHDRRLVFADTAGILEGNLDLNGVVAMPPRPTAAQSLALAARLWRRYDLAISTQCGDRPTSFAIIAGRIRVGASGSDSQRPYQACLA